MAAAVSPAITERDERNRVRKTTPMSVLMAAPNDDLGSRKPVEQDANDGYRIGPQLVTAAPHWAGADSVDQRGLTCQ
jgi:hypothetical protein